jgi:uncharacterized protein
VEEVALPAGSALVVKRRRWKRRKIRFEKVSKSFGGGMNIRRLVLDVDKAVARPSVVEIARTIEESPGVQGVNVTVTEIDIETVGMEVTIEGENLDYDALVSSIDSTGAVVHSVDEVVSGKKIVERIARKR